MALPAPTLLLFTLFLITTPPPSNSLSYTQFQTLFSLSHSLMTRVANLRASRGDLTGSVRARVIARKLERGMGLVGVVSDVNELLRSLNELTRMESDAQRGGWVNPNYRNVLTVSGSLLQGLLKVFRQSGPLRKVVETVQKEVVEGDLLRDCLELGSNDLKGLIQIFKDIALQFASNSDRSDL